MGSPVRKEGKELFRGTGRDVRSLFESSTIIPPLEDPFREYLNSDGAFVPDESDYSVYPT